LKKILSAAVLLISLVGFTQSASALTGFADTQSTAYSISKGNIVYNVIDSSSDVDWYVYQNNTGTGQSVQMALTSPATINLNVTLLWFHADGSMTTHPATDFGTGGTDRMTSITAPGDKLYYVIYPKSNVDYDPSRQYTFTIN